MEKQKTHQVWFNPPPQSNTGQVLLIVYWLEFFNSLDWNIYSEEKQSGKREIVPHFSYEFIL